MSDETYEKLKKLGQRVGGLENILQLLILSLTAHPEVKHCLPLLWTILDQARKEELDPAMADTVEYVLSPALSKVPPV